MTISCASTPLRDWPGMVLRSLQQGAAVVRIVVARVKGSAPREAGAWMLVGERFEVGTIGGGQLEWQAVRIARTLLAGSATEKVRFQRFVLGGDMGQCCGGVVELWLERFGHGDEDLLLQARAAAARGPAVMRSDLTSAGTVRRVVADHAEDGEDQGDVQVLLRRGRAMAPPIVRRSASGDVDMVERLDDEWPSLWLYGAGNVGHALVRIVSQLPLRVTWIDSRSDVFPESPGDSVQMLTTIDPASTVGEAPPGSYFAVMTHSHAIDYLVCRAILMRDDIAWAGLIGSKSKAARFRARLARDHVSDQRIGRLVCPIGVPGIQSKWPAAIAVAVAAQLLQIAPNAAVAAPVKEGGFASGVTDTDACDIGRCEGCGKHEPAQESAVAEIAAGAHVRE